MPPAATSKKISTLKERLGNRSIVLVGHMGAGKSALGRRLAAKLNLPFCDADAEIEKAAGKTISEIFADHGEAYFRDGEKKVVTRILRSGPQVLATGGGAFMNEETRAAIRELGVSVWIRVDLPLLMKRVMRRPTRPLLQTENPEEVMKELMNKRNPVYGTADIIVDSKDVGHMVMVNAIIANLASKLQTEQ